VWTVGLRGWGWGVGLRVGGGVVDSWAGVGGVERRWEVFEGECPDFG